MSRDVIIGSIVVFVALGFMTYLVFRSIRTIKLIHNKNLNSAREITQTINETR